MPNTPTVDDHEKVITDKLIQMEACIKKAAKAKSAKDKQAIMAKYKIVIAKSGGNTFDKAVKKCSPSYSKSANKTKKKYDDQIEAIWKKLEL